MNFASSENEVRRLEALYRYQVLDSLPEAEFDHMTRFARHFLQVPVVMINLVDLNRIWIKSAQGTLIHELDRASTCCDQTIAGSDVYTISDLHAHPQYRTEGIAPDPVRAYAGAPLITPDGHRIGALAAFDTRPREFSLVERRFLQELAAIVVDSLELRLTVRLWQDAQHHSAALAHHDPLTGLPNRLKLLDHAQLALHQAHRSGHSVALMIMDLDGFKGVNDSLGHSVGDELLREVGRRLCSSIRLNDTVARFGGDEFVILLPDLTDPLDAARVAQKLLDAVQRPMQIGTYRTQLSASLGIAIYPVNGLGAAHADPDAQCGALLEAADTAMYEAKAAGKAQYQFYSEEMTLAAQRRRDLRARLALALQDGSMTLHYQPQVDLQTGQVVGVEALARWPQPDGSWVPPLDFIPLAEEAHLMPELGAWVLRAACRQLMEWRTQGFSEWTLSVNVSGRQWRDVAFFDLVQRVLKETGFPPDRLVLDVTEASTLAAPQAASHLSEAFAAQGIRLALDDFGRGYTSLSQLQNLCIQQVKVDPSCVQRLGGAARARAVTETIITLGRRLGLTVVGEGIETPEQRDQLRALACHLGQGYFLGPPVPPEEFLERYANRTA